MIKLIKYITKQLLYYQNISFFKNVSNEKLYDLIKLFHPKDLGYNLIRVNFQCSNLINI